MDTGYRGLVQLLLVVSLIVLAAYIVDGMGWVEMPLP